MYKETLDRIIAMVKISEALDQNGYVEEAGIMMYNAFELAEDAAWRMAENLNNMTKTASIEDRTAKLAELENMTKTATFLSNVLERAGNWLTGKGGNILKQKGVKGLQKGMGEASQKVGEFLGRASEDAAREGGLLPKIWRKAKPREMSELGSELSPGKPGGLTDLGKLGLGAAGVGALGAGALALRGRGREPQQPGQVPPNGSGIPSATPPSSVPSTPSAGGGGQIDGGTSSAQIASIEQRMNNLEQVVNAIRAKVGV